MKLKSQEIREIIDLDAENNKETAFIE